jgi:hypothetical protein
MALDGRSIVDDHVYLVLAHQAMAAMKACCTRHTFVGILHTLLNRVSGFAKDGSPYLGMN